MLFYIESLGDKEAGSGSQGCGVGIFLTGVVLNTLFRHLGEALSVSNVPFVSSESYFSVGNLSPGYYLSLFSVVWTRSSLIGCDLGTLYQSFMLKVT